MNMTMEGMRTLTMRTLTEPRAAVRDLLDSGIPRETRWPILALVVLISTLLSGVLNLMSPAQGPMAEIMGRPFISALITFSGLVVMIFGLHWTGRSLGGRGELSDMVLAMAWLQFMLFIGQIVILVVALVLPPLGALLFLAYLGFSVWMAVAFVDAVHGFNNYTKSFGVILVALVAIGIGLSIFFTLLGVGSTGGSLNV